ncbi:metallophosphoesterase [Brachybacterium huguangmaarense]|uniref:Metallophosphoesterase n=1 Tax=Brachybacterium huguangmaarense TaxID=1652028 RepID=A0ABY6G4E9_9MICO|nr:metallophosphoesterase [Brachybacterium huguangmaarense]UYG17955.1 metallophosphoesterase [Brachybacterium huguangmaarense]
MRNGRRRAAAVAVGAAALGAAAAHVWARRIEIHRYTLRREELHVLPAGADPVRLLHISDIHLMPEDRRKLAFLKELGRLDVDLVVDTGDNIASARSVAPLVHALDPLLHRPGAFVMGSNDMYAPGPKNPLRYFLPDARPDGYTEPERPLELPTEELAAGLSRHGWRDLTNRRDESVVDGLRIRWVGVDDPHLERDEMPAPAEDADPATTAPVVRIAVAHAPYRRVLDAFVRDGADLILAGHTHGGQLRVPGFGALVTNCDLPRSQARGLSTWSGVPLHVSAGMGASPYSNYRFATPPEATLLTLLPRDR